MLNQVSDNLAQIRAYMPQKIAYRSNVERTEKWAWIGTNTSYQRLCNKGTSKQEYILNVA